MSHTGRQRRRLGLSLLLMPTLVAGVLFAPAALRTASAHASSLDKDVTANLFEYDFDSIATDCTDVLGPDGYSAVQVAPPEDSYDQPDHYWWDVYQPVDYSIGGRLGTEAEFENMISACHAAGVKVYVDAVLNHMAAGDGGEDASYDGQSFDSSTLTYPAYTSADFHSYPANCPESSDSIVNWLSYTEVTQCRLDGLPDLATGTTAVRDAEAAYLNSMIEMGADGFRLDSATEIGETDIAAVESLLDEDTTTGEPVSITQEVYPGSSGQDTRLDPTSFEGEGSVTAFDYTYAITDDFEDGDLAALDGYEPELPSAYASTMVTNQDTERASSPSLSYTDGAEYDLADEFLLAYGYGAPQIFSSFEYSSYNQAPPDTTNGDVTNTVCGTGAWECTEQNPAVDAMVAWHNLALTDDAAVANWTADGNDLIAFSRGDVAWIAINNGGSAETDTFPTGLPDGSYCDIVADTYSDGTCSGAGIVVADGQATVTVPADGSVAIDADSVIGNATAVIDVTVPSATPSSDTVYIAGDFSALGTGIASSTDWEPGLHPMTRISGTDEWQAVVHAVSGTTLEYKFDLNGTWTNVEEGADCADLANRTFYFNGANSDYTAADQVADWAGLNGC
jgi:alpha-amylase